MTSIRTLSVLSSLVLLLTGCLGSPEPYKPGYQPRPVETEEDIVARELARVVPARIVREDAYLAASRKETARILATQPDNIWNQYEWDLVDTLGERRTAGVLGRRPVPKPKPKGELPKKKDDSGDDDDDDDSGDDDDDDDSGDDDDDDSGDDDDDSGDDDDDDE